MNTPDGSFEVTLRIHIEDPGETNLGSSRIVAYDNDDFMVWEYDTIYPIIHSCLSSDGSNITVVTHSTHTESSESLKDIIVFRSSSGEQLARISDDQLMNLNPDEIDVQLIADAYASGTGWPFNSYPLKEVKGIYMFSGYPYVVRALGKYISCRDLYGKLIWEYEPTCGIKRSSLDRETNTLYVYSSYHKGREDEEIDEMYFDVATGRVKSK